jgi:hypothetical protein
MQFAGSIFQSKLGQHELSLRAPDFGARNLLFGGARES